MRFLTKIKAKTHLPKLHFKSNADLLTHGLFRTKKGIEPLTVKQKKEAYLIYYHEDLARTLEEDMGNKAPGFNKGLTNKLTNQFGGTWQEAYEKASAWHDARYDDLRVASFFDPTKDWDDIREVVDNGDWGESGSDYALGDAGNPGGEPKRPPKLK